MQTWGLALVTTAGGAGEPGAGRGALRCRLDRSRLRDRRATSPCALRAIAAGLLALLAVNYAWALVDRDRRFLHDRLAGHPAGARCRARQRPVQQARQPSAEARIRELV